MYKIEPFQFSFENCRICGHPPRGKRFCYWCGASLDIDDKEPYDKRSLEEQHGGLSCSVVHGRGKRKQSHEEWITKVETGKFLHSASIAIMLLDSLLL